MSPVDDNRPLADRLRDEEAIWRLVEEEVVPHVLTALQRRYGPGRHWHDLEGFVRSAERTALRRLRARIDHQLDQLETLEQFERWLVVVAGHKFHRALLRATLEQTNDQRSRNAKPARDLLNELTQQSAVEVVAELEAELTDEISRAVFHGKLQQKTEAEIAADLRCSMRKVRGIWSRVRLRLLRRASDLASEEGPRPVPPRAR
jgi:DNA-directed RNA polymerase specialized sigma24 family protein